jgi:hypothetical protein
MARVAVIVAAISRIERWNSFAMGASTNTRTKKSNASSVQPKKLARRAFLADF